MTDTPAVQPAARKLLDAMRAGAVLTGERAGTSETIRYVLRESDAHGEILRTTYLPALLIAGMCGQKLLDARESKKVGLALYLIYRPFVARVTRAKVEDDE